MTIEMTADERAEFVVAIEAIDVAGWEWSLDSRIVPCRCLAQRRWPGGDRVEITVRDHRPYAAVMRLAARVAAIGASEPDGTTPDVPTTQLGLEAS